LLAIARYVGVSTTVCTTLLYSIGHHQSRKNCAPLDTNRAAASCVTGQQRRATYLASLVRWPKSVTREHPRSSQNQA
jgi:hypothetical protein